MNAKIIATCLLMLFTASSFAGPYEDEVANWTSHKDVANWLQNNFSFDKQRQKKVVKRLRQDGADGLLARKPAHLFENSNGYCVDASYFALQTLNKINPSYNARWVFISNERGRPNHWVTAFTFEGKLYIMDYGTGRKWEEMQGVHGPYDSLDDYKAYLGSLDLPRFEVGEVWFRHMPGEED